MSASDFLELLLTASLLILAAIYRRWLEPHFIRFSINTKACMIVLAILPVALRVILISNHPIPSPDIYDEFGHLFVADTLRHWRLSNPTHPLHQFFETFFILQ